MTKAIAILPLTLLLGAQNVPIPNAVYSLPHPRPEPRAPARPVTPIDPPQSWVAGDNYPPAARSAHVTGTTGFRLDVDAAGKVRECTVLVPSGSGLLDKATCGLLSRRARFNPAQDAAGRRIPGKYVGSFAWAIADTPALLDNWLVVSRIGFDAAGEVEACSTASQGPAVTAADPCSQMADLPPDQRRKLLGDAKGPVVIEMVEEQRVEGVPMRIAPDGTAGTGPAIYRRRIAFAVDAKGEVGACRVLEQSGEDLLHYARYACHPGLRYPDAGKGGKVTQSFSVTRRIAPPAPPPDAAPKEDTV